ncbi:hypothetical protein BMT55_16505 [Listeria newyorkensis]|uniref:Uncharacterized protein n=1 Tax=Listeria newyorkensis TaxID=1497681 RepID=A0ABX4XIM7_9LIST|nr:hypothetical protein [Listeria newyorkensis]KGL37835.1 hypothetical protein EP58_16530 [Listeria newyorkensis]PNP87062.1 hypothetical protein BMT55_16505 [Listeria newyorkensis]WAO20446.1 hypothetical protein OTR81_09005 [Listeria newyorkensis]SQC56625.1 Uncharacterised protein [Listeria newyorkensis]
MKHASWKNFWKLNHVSLRSTFVKFLVLLHLITLDIETEMQQIEAEMQQQKYHENRQEERNES